MIFQQKLKSIMVAENGGCSLLSIGLSLGNMVAMTTTVSFVCFSTCTGSPIFPFSHGEIITFLEVASGIEQRFGKGTLQAAS